MKPKVAIVRGAFLNAYEMQFYEPLIQHFDITAFASKHPFHSTFSFPTKKLYSPMDITGIPFKMPIINRLFTDAHYLLGLEKQLEGFDLVHTAETYYHYTQQALAAKRQKKVKKVIATVLENIPFNNEGIYGRKEFKQRSREELDHIIALTERTKTTLLLEGADEKKITVIPHFIDTKKFTPTKRDRAEHEPLRILFCGRLEKYKGVYSLLYAYSLLKKQSSLPKTELYIVGNGTEKEKLLAFIAENRLSSSVHFKHVAYEDMPVLYQSADIYVAPSTSSGTWMEQYNTTLLEAQAAGLPIVTTYSGGIPENVGDCALLVPPDDVYALTQALQRFLLSAEKREEFGLKARKRALEHHDISLGAKKIADVWDRVLSTS
jgi:alpha-maltose-1-phosphate synthase